MKRHHWLMLGAVAILVAGWLMWNALSVEEDLTAPGGAPAAAPGARP
jgi:hypothetical protein